MADARPEPPVQSYPPSGSSAPAPDRLAIQAQTAASTLAEQLIPILAEQLTPIIAPRIEGLVREHGQALSEKHDRLTQQVERLAAASEETNRLLVDMQSRITRIEGDRQTPASSGPESWWPMGGKRTRREDAHRSDSAPPPSGSASHWWGSTRPQDDHRVDANLAPPAEKSLQEWREFVAALIPQVFTAHDQLVWRVTMRGRYSSRCHIHLPSANHAKKFRDHVRDTEVSWSGSKLWGGFVLSKDQRRVGWQLRQAKQAIEAELTRKGLGSTMVEVDRAAREVYLGRKRIASIWNDGHFHKLADWPGGLDFDALFAAPWG